MKRILIKIIICILGILWVLCSAVGADEYRKVDSPHQYQTGSYIYGGTIINIKRLDDNNDWIEDPNGGLYKYRVDCHNCGECWHHFDDKTGEERCYMRSKSWEDEQKSINDLK